MIGKAEQQHISDGDGERDREGADRWLMERGERRLAAVRHIERDIEALLPALDRGKA
jgi:hypothetical protein